MDHGFLPGVDGKKLGWSTSGQLVTGGDKLVSIQADFPRAETYCLEFSKSDSTNGVQSNLPIRAEAFITWSVEGNSVSRKVSIANGVTVQGVAQAVKVVIRDVTAAPAGPPPIPNGVPYNVSVQVTPGSRGSNNFPPFLTPTPNIGRNLSLVNPTLSLPVPPEAGVISFLVEAIGFSPAGFTPLKPGTLILNMIQNLVVINTVDVSEQLEELIPIVPGTDSIQMLFQPGFDPTLTNIVFTLMYGIDG